MGGLDFVHFDDQIMLLHLEHDFGWPRAPVAALHHAFDAASTAGNGPLER